MLLSLESEVLYQIHKYVVDQDVVANEQMYVGSLGKIAMF
jgi:hypothetical protein